MRDSLAQGSTPSTAPLSLIFGLKAACDMLESEGLDKVFQRHVDQGVYVRAELDKLGLRTIAEEGFESPTVTVVQTPEGITSGQLIAELRERHGIEIAAGQGPMKDSVVRIGHMGWTDYPELERTLKAIDDVLEHIPAATTAAV